MKRNGSYLKVYLLCFFVVSLILYSTTAFGATLGVPAPYTNIQWAINEASDGDTVLVADGTYTGAGNKDLNFNGKAIIVQSENGPDDCIIDCEGNGRGFYFDSSEGQDSVVSGFTIMNSDTNGIRCANSSPVITNCKITGNSGEGIICGDYSSPTINNCMITDNTANNGGGIHF